MRSCRLVPKVLYIILPHGHGSTVILNRYAPATNELLSLRPEGGQVIAQPAFKLKELDYSGASHLYTSTPSRINVVEVTLTVPVDGNALQLAVEDTLERMPYFADALKEIDGLFYYAENPLPFVVCEGGPRAVGGP